MANEEWIQGMRQEFQFTRRIRLATPQVEPVKGATPGENNRAFHTKVVGVTFDNHDGRNRQDIIAQLSQSSKIHLERDRGNAFDHNAIKVIDIDGNQVGFLSKEISADLAPRIDSGEVFDVSISSLTGGGDLARGVNILINVESKPDIIESSIKGHEPAICISPDTRLFFFDTKTTGMPRDWNAPLRDLDNWPRLVQLAWILCDEAGNELAHASRIIRPQGFLIPCEAARVHGITTERALEEGIPLADALEEVLPQIEQADCAIAHNISFDEKILAAEFLRLGRPHPLLKKKTRCTMKEATDFCALPGNYGYKYPSLTELYRKLFKKAFDGAHDALADVRACKTAYYELRIRGVMA